LSIALRDEENTQVANGHQNFDYTTSLRRFETVSSTVLYLSAENDQLNNS